MKTRSSVKLYEVDRVLDRKLDDNDKYLYQVRWKGRDAGGDSWRSLDELTDAGSAIEEYEKSLEDRVANEEMGKQGELEDENENNIPNSNDEDEEEEGEEEASRKKVGKVTHFADNVEKKEQRIVGGKWQIVFEGLKG